MWLISHLKSTRPVRGEGRLANDRLETARRANTLD
ncbi:hypothetical protein CCACVL1_29854 [Corchorus capsularis]|uniref:Uncharacterized protein n=1 Tax=Corchorus capsularis TaxID=210143 RepID=A0A1R3FZR8_COCAP|nr:hypothetical protein CCACVL1_29854 [Corchorus capsularis]